MSSVRKVLRMYVPAIVLALVVPPVAFGAGVEDHEKALKELQAAKLTLDKAITMAEEYSQGKAVSAHVMLNRWNRKFVIVHCLTGDKCTRVQVDLEQGEAKYKNEIKQPRPKDGDDVRETAKIISTMEKGQLTLHKVIEAAEKHTQGTAVLATPAVKEETLEVTVCCKAGEKWLNVFVDGATGKVLRTEEVKEEQEEEAKEKDKP